jgi:alpha-methylacyl-CoA racemase
VFVEGADGVLQPAPAPGFSRTPGTVTRPPAPAGTHSREVLQEAGFPDVEALIAAGVVVQT